MIINSSLELINHDELYGYCAKTRSWEVITQLTEVKQITNKNRMVIKGLSKENHKLANQVNKDFYEELKNKFKILQ